MRRTTAWLAAALALGALASGPGRALAQGGIEDEGSIGLSAFGDFGWITGQARYGLDFSHGGGYGVTLRYVASPHASLGLYFQSQTYTAKDQAKLDQGVKKLVSTQIMGDLYYYRDRAADASQYLVVGVGFYRPEIHFQSDEILFPGENLVVSGGGGAEVFIRENWGLDLSGRAFAYFGKGVGERETITAGGSVSIGLTAQIGLLYYLAN